MMSATYSQTVRLKTYNNNSNNNNKNNNVNEIFSSLFLKLNNPNYFSLLNLYETKKLPGSFKKRKGSVWLPQFWEPL